MIRLEYVKGKDFMSLKDVVYSFTPEPLALNGDNRDRDDQKSNGSGKSSFLTLIEWVLVHSNSRKQLDKKLVRKGCKFADGELSLYCPTRNERLRIERRQKISGSSLEVYVNDVELEFSKVTDGDALILEWLGVDKEYLYRYVFLNNERFKSFFHLSESDRMGLMSTLSGSKALTYSDEVVKDEMKGLNDDLAYIEAEINSKEGQISVIEADIDELSKFDEGLYIEQAKQSINSLIKAKTEEGLSKSKELPLLDIQLKEAQSELERLKEDYTHKHSSIADDSEILNEIKVFTENLSKQKQRLAKAENILAGSIECPKCKHNFSLSFDGDLDKLPIIKDQATAAIKELEEAIKRGDEGLASIRQAKQELGVLSASINKTELRIKEIEFKKYSVEKDLAQLRSSLLSLKNDLNSIKPPNNGLTLNDKKVKLGDCQDRLANLKSLKEMKVAEIEKLTQWKADLKSFNMTLVNSTLGKVSDRCNNVLESMGSDMRVKIDGFKVNAKGAVSEKITPLVVRDLEEESFFYYSGGERAKIVYASIVAIKELVDSQSKYGGLDLIAADEIFEGLEELGFKYLFESITDDKTIFLVTHSLSDYLSGKCVTVIQENGIGRIGE